MQFEQKRQKEHSQFISFLAAKVAGFSNQMVQYLIKLMYHGPQKKMEKKKSQDQDQQNTSQRSSEIMRKEKQEQKKKKYFKVRNRLPIDADAQRPKAPTSSFLIYYHDNKLDLAKKYKETNVSKLTKLASLEWKNLRQQERIKYQKISDNSKDRYQKEMSIYKVKYADQIEEALKKRRAQYRNNWINKKKAQQAKEKGESAEDVNSSLQFSDQQQVA